ncbi:hypothetical protein QJS66_00955 [Kocuria rhizophila]|nr:hypothetical protein QJS66_00955 [Kocuria rhizophila]
MTKTEADIVQCRSTRFDEELANLRTAAPSQGSAGAARGRQRSAAAGPPDATSPTAPPRPARPPWNSGIRPEQIGLFINASVTRNDQPAVAVGMPRAPGPAQLRPELDMTNACLGFVNALTVASSMTTRAPSSTPCVVAGEDPSPVARGRPSHG